MMLTLLLLTACSSLVLVHGQLTWRLLNKPDTVGPEARTGAAIGYDDVNQRVIIFGGKSDSQLWGDTWQYVASTDTWTELTSSSSSPPPRFSLVFAVSGRFFYIATGEGEVDGSRQFYNDIWKLNLDTDQWQEMSQDGEEPRGRYGAAGGIYQGSSLFYLSHGFRAKDRRFADAFVYDTVAESWTRVHKDLHSYNPSYPHARCLVASSMVSENHLLMFGGCLSGGLTGGPCPSGDVWIFDGTTGDWSAVDGCASPRTNPSMAMLPIVSNKKRIVLYGGQEQSGQVLRTSKASKGQVAIYDPDTETWTLRTTNGDIPEKRELAAMASGSNGVYMYGGQEPDKKEGYAELYLLEGDADSAEAAALDASCDSTFINLILLHGILMFLGWGICLPWGAFIARYLKFKDPLWFHLHRFFQISGLVLSLGGFACAVASVQFDHMKFAHAIIGLIVMLLGIQQPFNALIRPHKPTDGMKTPTKRLVWELLHKNLGRLAIILALINISLGLFLGLARSEIWITWYVYLGLVIIIWIVAEIVKCVRDKKCGNSSISSVNMTDAGKGHTAHRFAESESTQ